MSNAILSLEDVTLQFWGSITVLSKLSMDVKDGEILVIVGPSGSGKTTILNLAAGLLFPTQGEVRFEGKPVNGPDPSRGVVFQQYALFPWMTVRQNVEYGLKLQGKSKEVRHETADRYLALVGLADASERLPKELSGGMKQRTAIARAYAANPHMLLMDEPFGALDAQTRFGLQLELMKTWAATRKSIMFITHDIDEALLIGKRIVVLSANPGTVNKILDVPFAYPRDLEIQQTDEYRGLRHELFQLIYNSK